MEIVIEKINVNDVETTNVIVTDNAVKYISNELKKYEEGEGEIPYFNFYRERFLPHKNDYRFAWCANYDDTEEIEDGAYIIEAIDHTIVNSIEWSIA